MQIDITQINLEIRSPQRHSPIRQRLRQEFRRILEGLRTGKLSQAQAAKLLAGLKAIRGEIQAERAADHGPLTPIQRAGIRQQLNQESIQIFAAKHGVDTAA